jgi:hypothetical protein
MGAISPVEEVFGELNASKLLMWYLIIEKEPSNSGVRSLIYGLSIFHEG